MDIRHARLAYFSPTGTTAYVVRGIAFGLGTQVVDEVDLTLPDAETRALPEADEAVTLIGAPVYGGRIPEVAERRLRRLRGNGGPAVVVAVYGNRAFDDALVELRDLTAACGFVPVAGAAFVGEHSYSTAATPIAPGRPDAQDVRAAMAFGAAIRERLGSVGGVSELGPLQVPGKSLSKPRRPKTDAAAPLTREKLCTLCGKCEEVCPVGAVKVGESVVTDGRACILCCACTRACPTGARVLDYPRINDWRERAMARLRERKAPETFIAAPR